MPNFHAAIATDSTRSSWAVPVALGGAAGSAEVADVDLVATVVGGALVQDRECGEVGRFTQVDSTSRAVELLPFMR